MSKKKANKIPLDQPVEDIVEQLQDAVGPDKTEEAWNKEIKTSEDLEELPDVEVTLEKATEGYPIVKEDELYRAMVEDGLIADASEEIVPRVDLDDEWRKYQEEHAAKLPPAEAILKPIKEPEFEPPVIVKREPFINLKPPVRTPGPATVKAVEGVQGHNRPRFYGGR